MCCCKEKNNTDSFSFYSETFFSLNKIIIEGVILIHGGLSVLLGEYLYTRGERTSIKT